MTDWVKFHLEICKGAKKGIPRAERFVYMELAREARANAGYIVLPVDMSDLDAVCEVLGGDREEILAAVKRFTKGPNQSLIFEGPKHRRLLRVVNWLKWNSLPEPAGASTPRSHKSRALKAAAKPRNHVADAHESQPRVTEPIEPSSAAAKPRHDSTTSCNGVATEAQRSSNGSQRQSQRQSQKRSRAEESSGSGSGDVVSTGDLIVTAEPNGTHAGEPGPLVSPPGGDLGMEIQSVYQHYLETWRQRNPQGGRPPGLSPFRAKLLEARLRDGFSAEDLKAACDGVWRSEWHVEHGYTMPEHALRDVEHVERFKNQQRSSKAVQSSDGYTEDDEREAQERFKVIAEQKRQARIAATGKDPMA